MFISVQGQMFGNKVHQNYCIIAFDSMIHSELIRMMELEMEIILLVLLLDILIIVLADRMQCSVQVS